MTTGREEDDLFNELYGEEEDTTAATNSANQQQPLPPTTIMSSDIPKSTATDFGKMLEEDSDDDEASEAANIEAAIAQEEEKQRLQEKEELLVKSHIVNDSLSANGSIPSAATAVSSTGVPGTTAVINGQKKTMDDEDDDDDDDDEDEDEDDNINIILTTGSETNNSASSSSNLPSSTTLTTTGGGATAATGADGVTDGTSADGSSTTSLTHIAIVGNTNDTRSNSNQFLPQRNGLTATVGAPGTTASITLSNAHSQIELIDFKGPEYLPLIHGPKMNAGVFHNELEQYEDKPWRKPNANRADYFNYGFNEDSWTYYCMKQQQLRSEQSFMQSQGKQLNAASNRDHRDHGRSTYEADRHHPDRDGHRESARDSRRSPPAYDKRGREGDYDDRYDRYHDDAHDRFAKPKTVDERRRGGRSESRSEISDSRSSSRDDHGRKGHVDDRSTSSRRGNRSDSVDSRTSDRSERSSDSRDKLGSSGSRREGSRSSKSSGGRSSSTSKKRSPPRDDNRGRGSGGRGRGDSDKNDRHRSGERDNKRPRR